MNELQVFKNDLFGEVRTVMQGGEPWFVAADVCRVLDHSNVSMAIDRLDDDERAKLNLGRQGITNVVNEFGLYALIMGSRKPEARAFKRWITHEVLPSIRKYGLFASSGIFTEPDTMAALVRALRNEQERCEKLEQRLRWATSPQAAALRERSREERRAAQEDDLVEQVTEKFLAKIAELISNGRAWVEELNEPNKGTRSDGEAIGYADEQFLYVRPALAYELVCRECRAQGVPFPVTQHALMRCLREAGAVVGNEHGKAKSTRPKRVHGAVARYLWVARDRIKAEAPEGSET